MSGRHARQYDGQCEPKRRKRRDSSADKTRPDPHSRT